MYYICCKYIFQISGFSFLVIFVANVFSKSVAYLFLSFMGSIDYQIEVKKILNFSSAIFILKSLIFMTLITFVANIFSKLYG